MSARIASVGRIFQNVSLQTRAFCLRTDAPSDGSARPIANIETVDIDGLLAVRTTHALYGTPDFRRDLTTQPGG
jgi:hypothetical protein